ncbi:MAG: alpha/beta hydrolase [Thermoanaerobaculia bacterium]
MKFIRVVALLVSMAAASTASAAGPSAQAVPRAFLDVEYANVNGESLRLDLYLPATEGPYPVIVSIHGGFWTEGTRDEGTAILEIARGYAIANIDYRLAPLSTFPAQIEDCKAAIRWLRAHAAQYDLNGNAIAVMGYSAGGHLAALVGTTAGVDELEGPEEGNAGYSSRVQAVVDYFGPTDLLKLAEEAPSCSPGDPNDPLAPPSLLIGCAIQECPDKTEAANPIRYVTPDDPPFLILHGTGDCIVPYQQSEDLFHALQMVGSDSKLLLYQDFAHADDRFLDPSVQEQVDHFLDEKLKGIRMRRRGVRHY